MSKLDEILAKKKFKKKEALWLLSFSDLSLVLMCFFVLLLSFSKIDRRKFENVQDNIVAKVKKTKQENLQTVYEKLKREVKRKKLTEKVSVDYGADGVEVEFKDGLLFKTGSASPNKHFEKTIAKVLNIIAKAPPKYHITLEGHTDDVPSRGGDYPSNWELSAARGHSLLKKLNSQGVAENRMSILALAHTKPKVDYKKLNGPELKRARSANRRVVVRIE